MLQITNYGLQITDYRSQITDYRSQITDHRLLSSGFKLVLTFFFFFLLGNPLFSQKLFTNLEDSVLSSYWINAKIVIGENAHSGLHHSISDSASPYGLGIESPFPEAVRAKNTKMQVEGWVKSNTVHDQAMFVITMQNDGNTVFWTAVDLKEILQEKETWVNFSKSILIPASVTKTGIVKAYLWNNDNRDTIAIDDLSFDFKEVPIRPFLTEIENSPQTESSLSDRVLMENTFYKIVYTDENKKINIYGSSGDLLIGNIRFYSEKSSRLTVISGFSLTSVKTKKYGKKLSFDVNSNQQNVEMELRCFNDSPRIEIKIEKVFLQDETVVRESLILESAVETGKVFRANRKMDTVDFQPEYWLDKQGVQFGKGNRAWLIYHAPSVSSMQLNTGKHQLWVNLDYEKDHPFLRFPLLEDTVDVKIDLSQSHYKKGDKRVTTFSVYAGSSPDRFPRFMKNPLGFLANYTWTEHADFTDIRTNRATFFGSEEIKNAENAIGGFVKYGVPVTKSVFYFNPDGVTNSEISNGIFTSLESTILNDTAFSGFLFQLDRLGHEICLHTPEQYTSTKKAMKKSLKFMSKNFASRTWIDHGYNNGISNNREDLVCDGVIAGSGNYSLKLWKKRQVNYFWNPYYEDFFTYDSLQFGELISKPYHGFGDYFPNPDFWQHPSLTSNLWHWPTKSVLYVENNGLWDYLFSNATLNDFVEGWCTEFNHCYPAWVDPAKGFWYYDENGTIKSRDGFNTTLERMAKLRNEGLLNLTTIKSYLDYRLATEEVDYSVLNDGTIKVTNTGGQKISGLSFAVQAEKVFVNEISPRQKIVGKDIIFWFDLDAGDSKVIRTLD